MDQLLPVHVLAKALWPPTRGHEAQVGTAGAGAEACGQTDPGEEAEDDESSVRCQIPKRLQVGSGPGRPRTKLLAAVASVRKMGKPEAEERLQDLTATV
jgi:hypothetical protein